jgi:hypothetical protein
MHGEGRGRLRKQGWQGKFYVFHHFELLGSRLTKTMLEDAAIFQKMACHRKDLASRRAAVYPGSSTIPPTRQSNRAKSAVVEDGE